MAVNRRLLLLTIGCFAWLWVLGYAIAGPLVRWASTDMGTRATIYRVTTLALLVPLFPVVAYLIARWYALGGARRTWTTVVASLAAVIAFVAFGLLFGALDWPEKMLLALFSTVGSAILTAIQAVIVVVVSWLTVLWSRRLGAPEHTEPALPADGAARGVD